MDNRKIEKTKKETEIKEGGVLVAGSLIQIVTIRKAIKKVIDELENSGNATKELLDIVEAILKMFETEPGLRDLELGEKNRRRNSLIKDMTKRLIAFKAMKILYSDPDIDSDDMTNDVRVYLNEARKQMKAALLARLELPQKYADAKRFFHFLKEESGRILTRPTKTN